MKKIFLLSAFAALALAGCDKDSSTATPNMSGADAFDSRSGTGKGGSLARFTIAANHLYMVDSRKLYTYSLATSAKPQLTSTIELGMDIETIFSYKDKLFIGSQAAMFIYSISNASNPERLGQASHVRACDPVVANDSVAYVTVRSGSTCGGSVSALQVYDIRTNLMNPTLRSTINMEAPYGLGMKGDRLYVCNGGNGLNVYNRQSQYQPQYLKTITGETFYDVIALDDILIAMVEGGTVLYGYQTGDELVKLSKIAN